MVSDPAAPAARPARLPGETREDSATDQVDQLPRRTDPTPQGEKFLSVQILLLYS